MLTVLTTKITELYEETKALLLDPQSYAHEVEISPVQLYLDFMEQALQRPINRMASIAAFLQDAEGLMVGKMAPFALLKTEAMEKLEKRYHESVKLMECYAILSPIHSEELTKEPHERTYESQP